MFKKKKIVLTSVLALAGVSLATVGFATWVVGLQKQTEDLTVNAIVDNSENQAIYLEAVTDSKKVEVAEKVAYTELQNNEIVKAQNGGSVAISDKTLQFTFTTLQYSVGNNVKETENPNHITFELLTTDECNIVKKANCLMDDKYRTAATDTDGKSQYHYLQFKEEFNLVTEGTGKNVTLDESVSTTATYKTYKVDKVTYTLNWGDFFGNADMNTTASPREFYNAKSVSKAAGLKASEIKSELFADADKANTELQKMKEALEGGTLSVKVSLSHK